MNELNRNERVLVALGAAMGSNCISCIEYHIPEARQARLTDSQIMEAIRLSDKVRQVPAQGTRCCTAGAERNLGRRLC